MADHSLLGLADSYGIELIHPRREGRTEEQIGRKGLSNRRWIVGGKLCFVLNHLGCPLAVHEYEYERTDCCGTEQQRSVQVDLA